MEYMTSTEASRKWNVTPRRIQQLCKLGCIDGVVFDGRMWKIPADAIIDVISHQEHRNLKRKPLPIGISGFVRTVTECYYVDKTLMIRDILDRNAQVYLFTRPRRFGKTLNMDMLKVFFEMSDENSGSYFQDKKIWKCGKNYQKHQARYPVIFLTLKDMKYNNWNDAFEYLGFLLRAEFMRHAELLTSTRCNAMEKDIFARIADGQASRIELESSLSILSSMLHKHYGIPAVIIIDEYDTPIQQGFSHGYYEEVTGFIRNLFSRAFKDNNDLAFGFLSGILRVAKESIFSGLNNLLVCSVLDSSFSEYFGFTHEEVKILLSDYGIADKYREVCENYDGYRFGNTEIFNPWSVLNYIDNNCEPRAYWQSTSSNDVIGELMESRTPEIMRSLSLLMEGQTVETLIDTSVIYPKLSRNPSGLFSFLLVTGYLKIVSQRLESGGSICEVAIPNTEVSYVYRKEIMERFGGPSCESMAITIRKAIEKQDFGLFEDTVVNYLKESASYLDTTGESFFHGLVLGLCAILSNDYEIRSNRESGLGRYDIQLRPRLATFPAFIFELKAAGEKTADLNDLAEQALLQIGSMDYGKDLSSLTGGIIKVGIAFKGKECAVHTEKP